jgi:hypothetical protein
MDLFAGIQRQLEIDRLGNGDGNGYGNDRPRRMLRVEHLTHGESLETGSTEINLARAAG